MEIIIMESANKIFCFAHENSFVCYQKGGMLNIEYRESSLKIEHRVLKVDYHSEKSSIESEKSSIESENTSQQ